MYTVLVILIVLASLILVLAVLVQNSKGGGLAANFASSNQTFGVRQTADILEKATWYLTVAIFVFCFAATATAPTGGIKDQNKSAVQKEMMNTSTGIPQSFPATGAAAPAGEQKPDSAK